MPKRISKSSVSPGKSSPGSSVDSARRCSALTTTGNPCSRTALPGLTVCRSHGGGTASSVRKSKRVQVHSQASSLWGISADTTSVNIVEELNKLARNKLTDITALRLKLGENPEEYYGLLTDGKDITDSDVHGVTVKKSRKMGVHPLVGELHKAEGELATILKMLREVTGDTSTEDVTRVRMQASREAARLLKAYPGMGVDEVAKEVAKRV